MLTSLYILMQFLHAVSIYNPFKDVKIYCQHHNRPNFKEKDLILFDLRNNFFINRNIILSWHFFYHGLI